jgi:hypothetical protein
MARFGRVPGLLDESSQPIYDTLTIASGTTTYRFFSVPISGAKSRLLTNMRLAGVLPAPQSFVVHAVRIILKEATSAQAQDCIMNTHCVFKVGEKEQLVAPTCLFSAGAGLYNVITTDAGQNGRPDARSLWVLPKPVVIGVQQNFYLDLIYDADMGTAKDGFDVLCVLDGYQTRGVQ